MKSLNLQMKFLPGNALSPALSIFLYSPEGEREGTGLRRWPVHVRGFLEAASDYVVFRFVFLREWSQGAWVQKVPGTVRWLVVLRVQHQGETYLLNQEAQTPLCDSPFVLGPFSIF